jgi:hypothetical protein
MAALRSRGAKFIPSLEGRGFLRQFCNCSSHGAAAVASVGAIHGVALLWLLRHRQEEASPAIEDA